MQEYESFTSDILLFFMRLWDFQLEMSSHVNSGLEVRSEIILRDTVFGVNV